MEQRRPLPLILHFSNGKARSLSYSSTDDARIFLFICDGGLVYRPSLEHICLYIPMLAITADTLLAVDSVPSVSFSSSSMSSSEGPVDPLCARGDIS